MKGGWRKARQGIHRHTTILSAHPREHVWSISKYTVLILNQRVSDIDWVLLSVRQHTHPEQVAVLAPLSVAHLSVVCHGVAHDLTPVFSHQGVLRDGTQREDAPAVDACAIGWAS